MKTALVVVLVAGLFAVAPAWAGQTAPPSPAGPDVQPAGQPAPTAPALRPPEPPKEQQPIPVYACVPTCSYYQNFCTTLCGTRGIKFFTCTPTVSPHCAQFTCTCNGFPG
jgi:hypothetical protein